MVGIFKILEMAFPLGVFFKATTAGFCSPWSSIFCFPVLYRFFEHFSEDGSQWWFPGPSALICRSWFPRGQLLDIGLNTTVMLIRLLHLRHVPNQKGPTGQADMFSRCIITIVITTIIIVIMTGRVCSTGVLIYRKRPREWSQTMHET